MGDEEKIHGDEEYVAEQERAAAEEAIAAGGGPVSGEEEESERALSEAGQGEAEGFELAEEELIENASHEESASPDPTLLAGEPEDPRAGVDYAEADTEESEDA